MKDFLKAISPVLVITLTAITLTLYRYGSPHLRGWTIDARLSGLVFSRNLALYVCVYGFSYLIFHELEAVRKALASVRLSPSRPERSRVREEIMFTLLSCLIGTGYELGLGEAITRGKLALNASRHSSVWFYLGFAFVFVWADLHFYMIHRLLHARWLFRLFHHVHHRSFDPNPWSGLSFHPIEALAYFSSLLIALALPLHLAHFVFLKVILDVAPVFGHLGYAGFTGGSRFHDLHHRIGRVNFGGTVIWDKVFGTYSRSKTSKAIPVNHGKDM